MSDVAVALWIATLLFLAWCMWKLWDSGRKEESVQGLKDPKLHRLPIANDFPIECEICDTVLDRDWVHIVSDVQMNTVNGETLAPGEGTAISATFCAAHCPGGCNREKEGSSV
jgi:hypothetical protein